jgi:hypothetical protein
MGPRHYPRSACVPTPSPIAKSSGRCSTQVPATSGVEGCGGRPRPAPPARRFPSFGVQATLATLWARGALNAAVRVRPTYCATLVGGPHTGDGGTLATSLTPIPVVDVREGGTVRHAQEHSERGRALRDTIIASHPPFIRPLVPLLDGIARRWLLRSQSPYVDEVGAIVDLLGPPGIWFLNGSYQWCCTALAREEAAKRRICIVYPPSQGRLIPRTAGLRRPPLAQTTRLWSSAIGGGPPINSAARLVRTRDRGADLRIQRKLDGVAQRKAAIYRRPVCCEGGATRYSHIGARL